MVSPKQQNLQINSFEFQGQKTPVSFVETIQVTSGVECDVYTFDKDPAKDLGVIRIKPGAKTPLQRVLKGDKTIEGYVSGRGKLTITKPDGNQEIHTIDEHSQKPFSTSVGIGELMQWEADGDSELVAYEVCTPPYEDGRFENIV